VSVTTPRTPSAMFKSIYSSKIFSKDIENDKIDIKSFYAKDNA